MLPFFLVTSLTGSAAATSSTETRLQVIITSFMAAVGIRYVSSSYVPHVSYATFLGACVQRPLHSFCSASSPISHAL